MTSYKFLGGVLQQPLHLIDTCATLAERYLRGS
jgi:hypothetical protein